ncbi:NAD(P)-dependent oxidoreductase [Photobacterium aphoticum]|uniref:NAD(P)-dependent oxidoreductase n=1 Tax=Photobacterium aphoticum TaxID=754436 RepID=UPI00069FE7CA|nr:NAD(P)-dependent oxidoreductase [Photobacterium aphoticum]PSU60298.1 siroheme synthase [Photobacterium aphoticum]GHA34708.1 ferrochelatase [Photobacterium aphoticum]
MDYLPIFLSLKNKKVVVIGGGEVACRKIDLLRKAEANITVVSPALHPYLHGLVEKAAITWINKSYTPDDLNGAMQVWVTTNNRALNHDVFEDAQVRGLWANVVDDKDYCNFITPSLIDRTPIQVAISSGGASPVLVRFLREKLETQLPQNLSLLADYAGQQRDRIKQYFKTVDERRKFWELFFRHAGVEQAQSMDELEVHFQQLLDDNTDSLAGLYLIETGTDPEMLSLKALRLMQQSEFVLFPSGKDDGIFLDLCRRDADRAPYTPSTLNRLVKQYIDEGLRVCVLADKQNASDLFGPLQHYRHAQYVPTV